MLYTLINIVEPLIMDTLNKGHLSIKDTLLERERENRMHQVHV